MATNKTMEMEKATKGQTGNPDIGKYIHFQVFHIHEHWSIFKQIFKAATT